MSTVIIHAELVMPPSWTPCVRDLTMYLNVFCNRPQIIIDCECDDIDLFYRWLKPKGYADFIDDFVRSTRPEDGIHLRAHAPRFPKLTPEYLSYAIYSLRDSLRVN